MQFLAFLETVASNLNGTNIAQFITLTENLISLGESVFEHQASTSPSAPTATSSSATTAASTTTSTSTGS